MQSLLDCFWVTKNNGNELHGCSEQASWHDKSAVHCSHSIRNVHELAGASPCRQEQRDDSDDIVVLDGRKDVCYRWERIQSCSINTNCYPLVPSTYHQETWQRDFVLPTHELNFTGKFSGLPSGFLIAHRRLVGSPFNAVTVSENHRRVYQVG